MRELKDEGVLSQVKLSNYNFQIFWTRGEGAPAVELPAPFEVN